jgi:ELWxxDGT repeat protein
MKARLEQVGDMVSHREWHCTFSTFGFAGLAEYRDEWYFAGRGADAGRELWKVSVDGARSLVADIKVGVDSSNPAQFFRFGENLLFAADDGLVGRELWKIDPAGQVSLFADINPGDGSARITSAAEFGDHMFVAARVAPKSPSQLFRIDEQGVVETVLFEGQELSAPRVLGEFDGQLLVRASIGEQGGILWSLGVRRVFSIDMEGKVDEANSPAISGVNNQWSSDVHPHTNIGFALDLEMAVDFAKSQEREATVFKGPNPNWGKWSHDHRHEALDVTIPIEERPFLIKELYYGDESFGPQAEMLDPCAPLLAWMEAETSQSQGVLDFLLGL